MAFRKSPKGKAAPKMDILCEALATEPPLVRLFDFIHLHATADKVVYDIQNLGEMNEGSAQYA